MSLLLALFMATAEAGKLSTGFRGLPFGSDSVLARPPIEDGGCQRAVQSPSDWSWLCRTELNGVPVYAFYASSHGYFYAVTLMGTGVIGSGGLLSGTRMREGAISAWGPGGQRDPADPKNFPDWIWMDGSVGAVWVYDPIKDQTGMTITDVSVKRASDAAAIRDAGKSRGDF